MVSVLVIALYYASFAITLTEESYIPLNSEDVDNAMDFHWSVRNGDKVGVVPLRNNKNTGYYGYMNLGTPGSEFRVSFDTTTQYFFVGSADCPSKNYACKNHRLYNHSTSSTYKKDGTRFEYIRGKAFATGYYSIDNINIGGVKIENQKFAELDMMSDEPFAMDKADVRIGLGLSNLPGYIGSSVFLNAVEQTKIKPVFSFFLNQYSGESSNTYGGEFILGGYDNKHFKGSLKSLPLVDGNKWSVKSTGMEIGGAEICKDGCDLVFSIEETFIFGPKSDVDIIHSKMAILDPTESLKAVDCLKLDKLPNITMKFGDKTIILTPKQYIFRYGFSECYSGFIGIKEDPNEVAFWKLGLTFFRSFYTVFDAETKTISLGDLA